MNRRRLTVSALLTLAVLLCAARGVSADGKLIRGDYSHYALLFESRGSVTTWEEGGVRVFVAYQGGVLRQGPVRLAAPRMVMWFDKAASSRPDVHAAQVRVFAEGSRETPVRLVEGQRTESYGAVVTRFTSTLSFAWDCPLRRAAEAVPSALLSAAIQRAENVQEQAWKEFGAITPQQKFEAATQILKAREVHVFWEERPITVVYLGDVHGGYGNLELHADAAVLWYDRDLDEIEAYAQGNVRIARRALGEEEPEIPGVEFKGATITDVLRYMHADELYINPKAARARATNPDLRMRDPEAPADLVYVFHGNEAYMVDSNTLVVQKASGTTCDFARPHFQFTADRMQVTRQGESTVLSGWDVRFKAGDDRPRTLLPMPFLATDLTARSYLLTDYAFGTSSKFGTFLQTTWAPLDLTAKPPGWVDTWTVNLDYYGRRGPAAGTELLYEFGKGPYPKHEGRLRAYYVNDGASEDDTEQPVPKNNRGRVHLEHRWQLSRDWRVDAECYWLSDSQFLNEFFETDFEEEKVPETYVLARYLRNSTYLAVLFKQQINDFITDVNERPSADIEIMGMPLGRLLYDASLVVGNYDLEFNDELVPKPADPPSVLRGHTQHKLSLPFNWGIFRVSPFARALATWVSDSMTSSTAFDGTETLAGFGGGATVSTTFSREFAAVSDLFDMNRLRHIVTPYVRAEALSVSGDSADLIQMDQIDAIDGGTEVALGLRQVLQTKRLCKDRWTSVDWLELDTALVARSSDSVNEGLDSDYLRLDLLVRLTEHLVLRSSNNRVGFGGDPDVLNAGIGFDYLPKWALDVDYDYITDRTQSVTVSLSRELSDRYRLLLYEQYEFDSRGTGESKSLETSIVLRRLLHKWVLDLGLHIEEANDEVALILGFGPAGWGVFKDPHRAARR